MIKRKLTKQNPTNKELLKEIKIEKFIITEDEYWTWGNIGQILYRIRNKSNNKLLGQARYDPKLKVVNDIVIYSLKRQGLATYLYDYIESDQKIKLKPSDDLLDDGKAFWKNRLKRNPTDIEFLKKIKIIKRKLKVSNEIKSEYNNLTRYDIYFNNEEDRIGYVLIRRDDGHVRDVEIDEEYRRKGLASFVYDYIEKDLKIKLRPSNNQLEDGFQFWKSRLKKNFKQK